MSSLIVEVSRVERLSPHPNADKLELAQIKGWQCVVPKGRYAAGDLVTYVPVDAVLPAELSDRLGVTKYLSKGRVRCARLRGEPSFGVIIDREDASWAEGTDVAARYGITKYAPPLKMTSGDAEAPHPLFEAYTDVENLRNFPSVIAEGEEVVATEKIHGANCRVGLVVDEGTGEAVEMAGSREVRRRKPVEGGGGGNLYWFPWTLPGVAGLLRELVQGPRGAKQAVLFGEVFGRVQSLRYGLPNGLGFRAFDLLVDGRYADFDEFARLCEQFEVPTVPIAYRGPFSLEAIRRVSDGPSMVPGADHIREGVVVKPTRERTDPKLGRVILKYIGDTYLFAGDEISDSQDV